MADTEPALGGRQCGMQAEWTYGNMWYGQRSPGGKHVATRERWKPLQVHTPTGARSATTVPAVSPVYPTPVSARRRSPVRAPPLPLSDSYTLCLCASSSPSSSS
jgi:hypothetical protein